jgi:hypothetical protein
LEHDFYVPFHIWDVILPIDFHSIIFQDGYCTTNQLKMIESLVVIGSVGEGNEDDP